MDSDSILMLSHIHLFSSCTLFIAVDDVMIILSVYFPDFLYVKKCRKQSWNIPGTSLTSRNSWSICFGPLTPNCISFVLASSFTLIFYSFTSASSLSWSVCLQRFVCFSVFDQLTISAPLHYGHSSLQPVTELFELIYAFSVVELEPCNRWSWLCNDRDNTHVPELILKVQHLKWDEWSIRKSAHRCLHPFHLSSRPLCLSLSLLLSLTYAYAHRQTPLSLWSR